MSQAETSHRAIARWTSRVIPAVLAGIAVYGTYVIVARVCIDYLYRDRNQPGAVIAILILYFLFLFLSLWSYIRTIWIINTNTGLVPMGPKALQIELDSGRNRSKRKKEGDIESRPYSRGPDTDPDSPGLERFYSKDVFVCENDGRPRWCSECCTWKPDRAHHSSEIGRCVLKMDHYCPWVGGMVSETSFKFFCQFTFWCSLYCSVALVTAACCLASMVRERRRTDGHIIAAVAIGAFFGLFTFAMTLTSWRLIFLGLTNIDMLKKSVYQLAIRVPQGTPSTEKYTTITYPLSLQTQPSSSDRPDTHVPNGHSRDVSEPNASPDLLLAEERDISARDQLASRTFAVVRTERDENPWDRGWKRNWQDVMGTNVMDWLLPIRQSPCARHDNPESEYAMGPLVDAVMRRYGLDRLSSEGPRGIEMRSIGSSRRSHRNRPSA